MIDNENFLTFDDNNLFNSKLLHQYDEDGQKGFLGFLLRYKNWKIDKNKIVFPDIKNQRHIKSILKEYDLDIKKFSYQIQKQTLNDVSVFGLDRIEQNLKNEYKEIQKDNRMKLDKHIR